MALTDKQKRFCEEYMIDLNATQAAIRAGYSQASARQIATKMLSKGYIQEQISVLQGQISAKNGELSKRVIDELVKVGFSNVQDYLESGNSITDLKSIDREKAAAVSSIKRSVTEFGDEETGGVKTSVEFKLWDKLSALEKLGRYCGIFEVDNKQKSNTIIVKVTDE